MSEDSRPGIFQCQHCGLLIVWRYGAWIAFDQPFPAWYPRPYANDMCASRAYADDESHKP